MSPKEILFLAASGFLLLTPGVALQCRQCQSMPPDVTCHKQEGSDTCDTDPDANCSVARIYTNGSLYSIVRGCWRNEECNVEGSIGEVNIVIKCCRDSDLCNKDL